jgi:adenine-specific DNA-methyltransferase
MKHKTLGQVFTPQWIVDEILNSLNYQEENILSKKIIDPACGDGAFLKVIVKRIIEYSLSKKHSIIEIKNRIENNVFGIEIDDIEHKNCINNLNELVEERLKKGLNIDWKIYKDNTLLKYKDFLGYFDCVVGNPPYIRIHNLDAKTRSLLKKEFIFSEGTIDIYVSFFELGFKLLNKSGQLGYITPNSYLHNSSYKKFRKYLKDNNAVKILTDFKANKIFKNFSTYTAITIINFHEKNKFFIYKELKKDKIQEVNQINYDEVNDGDWSFCDKENMNFLKSIYLNNNKKISDFFDVQYGFATLRDKIYISEVLQEKGDLALFNNHWIEKEILRKIVKGSTYKGSDKEVKYILFPYKKNGSRYEIITEKEIKELYPKAYKYLLDNKEELLKRDIEKNACWYEFGRSQGIQTSENDKIILSTLVNNEINFYKVDKSTFVYSGIFIVKKKKEVNWDIIQGILKSKDFLKYIQITGKDFSGGYKSITSNQIKSYPTIQSCEQKTLFN